MRPLVGALLSAVLIIGGCASRHDSPRSPTESDTGFYDQREIVDSAPSADRADVQPSLDRPLPCREGLSPTKEEMIDLLVRLSTYAPLAYLTGPALELEEQWIRLEGAGWPPESGTWVSHGWFALSIQDEPDQTYVVDLEHGLYIRTHDRFQVVCNDGRWQVKQHAVGLDGAWMEPARELPGQRGELTPELATALAQVAERATGPWSAQVLTGKALEWERVDAMNRARGLKPLLKQWWRATDDVKLTPTSENLVEGEFVNSTLRIRLEKADGLWKIQDFTEGGQWTGTPTDMRLTNSGWVFDPPFSIQPGITNRETVERLLGTPDSVKADGSESVVSYDQRHIEVRFSAQGKVTVLSMKTGSPNSGVRVGSPVELWELVYGPQVETVQNVKQRLWYVSKDGKVPEIIYSVASN